MNTASVRIIDTLTTCFCKLARREEETVNTLMQKLNLDGMGWPSDLLAWSLSGFGQMFILLLFISLGLGELVRVIEYVFMDIPYLRTRFSAYLFGDIALAWAGALAIESVHRFDGGNHWYNQKLTYLVILLLSWAIAIGLEVMGVQQNRVNPLAGFTWQQQLVPSKAIHTLAFGPMLAILICLAIHVAINPVSPLQVMLIVLLVVFWAFCDAVIDPKRVDPNPDPESLPEERTNKTYLFVKAHPHPSRNRQMDEWRQRRLAEMAATP